MTEVNGTAGRDYIRPDSTPPLAGYNDVVFASFPIAGVMHGRGGADVIIGYARKVYGDDGDDLIKAFGNDTTVYDGGAGFDTVVQQKPGELRIKNIEAIRLIGLSAATLLGSAARPDEPLIVDATSPSGDFDTAFLDASAFDGRVHFIMDGGADDFKGSQIGNTIDIQAGSPSSSSLVGGAGSDSFNIVGTCVVSTDYLRLDGGAGIDTLNVAGNYLNPASFATLRIRNIENLKLGAGFDYVMAAPNDMVTGGALLSVTGTELGASNVLDFDGSAATNGSFALQGGHGDDRLVGGRLDDMLIGNAGDDLLDVSSGGADIASGGDGNDRIFAGSALTGADRIDGGSGQDVVEIDGEYNGLSIDAQLLVDVEVLSLQYGHTYTLSSSGSGFGGKLLTVDGTALGAGDALSFDSSGELDGRLRLYGGAAGDRLTGGARDDAIVGGLGNDVIDLSAGGVDTAEGDAGDDTFRVGAALEAKDRLDGGTGVDTVQLAGAYVLQLTATMLSHFETVELGAGFDYTLSTNGNLVMAGDVLRVDGRSLGAEDVLQFNGSNETGRLVLLGGDAADILRGGSADVSFTGGGGADQLFGGVGSDRFVYRTVADSTGPDYDTIYGFKSAGDDSIVFPTKIGANDPWVKTGTLSTNSFNDDLSAAIGADQLGVGNAVRFTADAGTLAGQTFLIADANGVAGYQANADFVIRLA